MTPRRTIVLLAAAILAALAAFTMQTPRQVRTPLAVALVVAGVMNLVFWRQFGSGVHRSSVQIPVRVVSSFWQWLGERNAQLFYLGIGVGLITVGFIAIILNRTG